MKKSIAIIVSLAVIAGLAFADDAKVAAPKATPKTEIWGSANLDHFTTGDEVAAGSYGNWYFNKARVGINTQASDTVSFVSEFDLVGLDLRLFNAMQFIGFNTFGEELFTHHNQTLTALFIGGKK